MQAGQTYPVGIYLCTSFVDNVLHVNYKTEKSAACHTCRVQETGDTQRHTIQQIQKLKVKTAEASVDWKKPRGRRFYLRDVST